MDHDRILDKIKKCLEMAKGKGSSPNEAEIALRQAHKLMDAYNLEMGDVLASMAGEAKVAAGSESEPPAWRVRLAHVCAEAFGTHFIISAPWFEHASFIFIGCGAAPDLAGYAYQVLERQLQKARRDYLATQKRCKRSTKVARGDAFAHGWIDAVGKGRAVRRGRGQYRGGYSGLYDEALPETGPGENEAAKAEGS